jgi:hypothetical protein
MARNDLKQKLKNQILRKKQKNAVKTKRSIKHKLKKSKVVEQSPKLKKFHKRKGGRAKVQKV